MGKSRVMTKGVYAALALILVLLALAVASTHQLNLEDEEVEGLLIAVTIPDLVKDLELITCSGDRVVLVATESAEHSYAVRPSLLLLARKADVLILAGKSALDEVLAESASGRIITLANILDEHDDEHLEAILYDPDAYLKAIREIVETLSSLRPNCREKYLGYAYNVSRIVEDMLRVKRRLVNSNVVVLVDDIHVYYTISWLGLNVVTIGTGHEVILQPSTIMRVEKLMSKRLIDLVIVATNSPASTWLRELAAQHSIPLIELRLNTHLPLYDKIRYIVDVIVNSLFGD